MQKAWKNIYCTNYISGYSPFNIKNMNKAIERLASAINNREKIVIYGGCDLDSICAISSLRRILKYLNADVEYCVSSEHEEKNYDIDEYTLREDIAFLGAELLITVGCGLKNKEVENLCNRFNIDLIIMENKRTKCIYDSTYINPSEEKCSYRYKDLTNSGLTFKLMQAIAIYYNMKRINKYLDLILIGSVSKNVKNKGENGIILKEGIQYLRYTNSIGLNAIKSFFNISDINIDSINKIVNEITPREGAISKKDNAKIIVELLTTNDKDRAEQITKYIYNEKIR